MTDMLYKEWNDMRTMNRMRFRDDFLSIARRMSFDVWVSAAHLHGRFGFVLIYSADTHVLDSKVQA